MPYPSTTIAPEFAVHRLNAVGLAAADEIARIFTDALRHIDEIVPTGRERALVVTKMQEACFFATRSIALMPEHQLR